MKKQSEKALRKDQKGESKRPPFRPWKKIGFWIACFVYAMTLPVFTNFLGLWKVINEMGYGTFRYSDDTYQDIEKAINACLINDAGVDMIALRTIVDECINSIKGDSVTLEAAKTDGFFDARVNVALDENYHVMENGIIKNYNSIGEYVKDVKIHQSTYSTLYGMVLWLIIGIIGGVIINLLIFFTSKENSNGENSNESKETENGLDEKEECEKKDEEPIVNAPNDLKTTA